jgi:tripartite ATP-independent transporter DctM subunit
METAGVWMLLAVAMLMIATGLPAWVVLIGVSLISTAIGLVAGVFTWSLLQAIPSRLLGLLESDLLQAMPLYVLIGALLYRLPLAETLLRAGERVFARASAAAGLSGLGLSIVLAPMNGSVGAGVAMLTRTVLPRLDAKGVAPARGAALVAAASTLGVVIPPSLVLILLSDAMLRAHTEALNITHGTARIVNTQDVFRGALIPAGILVLLYAFIVWRTTAPSTIDGPSRPAGDSRDWVTASVTVLLILGLFSAVILGYLYAVEAAATGGVALVLFALSQHELTLARLKEVLSDTMAVTGALFALLVGATVFTLIVRAFGTDRWVSSLLIGSGTGGIYSPVLAVMAILALCAFVLDAFEMTFVVIPVLMPPLLVRVPDVTWVAVLTLLILQTSFLVPPFGYAVMMLRTRTGQNVSGKGLARALLPYLLAQLVVLALVLAIPKLLWRDVATLDSTSSPAHTLTDDEVNELMRKQTEPGGGK